MAGISDKTLDIIKRRVVDMTTSIVVLKRKNLLLKNENLELKRELKNIKLVVKNEDIASALTDVSSKKQAKKWLNEILKEIETCKRIINK
ncbi:MAG: hypothetical protein IMY73_03210 [Bacteroidetes bacterium]|nr:hypothetical protein [Bacteroidota bacterium]